MLRDIQASAGRSTKRRSPGVRRHWRDRASSAPVKTAFRTQKSNGRVTARNCWLRPIGALRALTEQRRDQWVMPGWSAACGNALVGANRRDMETKAREQLVLCRTEIASFRSRTFIWVRRSKRLAIAAGLATSRKVGDPNDTLSSRQRTRSLSTRLAS